MAVAESAYALRKNERGSTLPPSPRRADLTCLEHVHNSGACSDAESTRYLKIDQPERRERGRQGRAVKSANTKTADMNRKVSRVYSPSAALASLDPYHTPPKASTNERVSVVAISHDQWTVATYKTVDAISSHHTTSIAQTRVGRSESMSDRRQSPLVKENTWEFAICGDAPLFTRSIGIRGNGCSEHFPRYCGFI